MSLHASTVYKSGKGGIGITTGLSEEDLESTPTWRDLLVHLQSAAAEDDEESVADLSLQLLSGDFDRSDVEADDVVPDDVLLTVRSVHLRALLRLGRHDEAVEMCEELRSSGGADAAKYFREEESYALYRLGRYGRARDLCRGALRDAGYDDPDNLGPDAPARLVHTYVQCLYRLGETRAAGEAYYRMLGEGGAEDEEEILANYLAARSSNRTYTGAPLSESEMALTTRAESKIDGGGEVDGDGGTYNYDLACNLASLLLASATSSSQIGRALALLSEAERGCVSSLSDPSELMGEVAPIKASMAYGHLLNGDEAKARGVLTKMAGNDKAGEGVNLMAGLNLAIMDGKVDGVASDLASAKRTVVTPALVRGAVLGTALVRLKKGDGEGCRSALSDLRSALDGGSTAGGKKKKKKGKAASSATAAAAPVPAASAASKEESRLWSNRIAMVESALLRSEGRADEADAMLDDALSKTEDLMRGASGDDEDAAAAALRYGLAELLLYKSAAVSLAASGDGEAASAESAIEAIGSLPREIRSRPALRGASASLHASVGRDDLAKQALEEGEGGEAGAGSLVARAALADHLLRRGKYEAAADAYRALLEDAGEEGEKRSEIAAGLVRALSYYDPEGAVEVARVELPELLEEEGGDGDNDIDIEELEARDMPRISTGSRRNRLVGADGGSQGKKKKRSHSSVLRRRAKLREAHLKKLESEGRIKPGAPPPKPDPERWIPKSQRSYNKRGRRGRGRFTGAQGTGAGAERDAAKLDALARAKGGAAAAADTGPSTAHMNVASSGTGRRKGGRR